MSYSTGQVPEWPHIRATIHDDGSGEVNLNGAVHQLSGNETLEDARRHMESHLAGIATWLSRPVRAFAETPEGLWSLVVHPDGTVEREAADEPTWSRGTESGDPDDPTPESPGAEGADDASDLDPDWMGSPGAALPQGLIFPPRPAPAEEASGEEASGDEAGESADGSEADAAPESEAAAADEAPADDAAPDEPAEGKASDGAVAGPGDTPVPRPEDGTPYGGDDRVPGKQDNLLLQIRRLATDATSGAGYGVDGADRRKVVAVAAVAVLLFGGGTVGYRIVTADADPVTTPPDPAPAASAPTESTGATDSPTVLPGTTVSEKPKPVVRVLDATGGKGWAALRVDSSRPVEVRLTLTPLGPRGKPMLQKAITRRVDVSGGERTALRVENLEARTYRWRIEVAKGRTDGRRTGKVEVVAEPSTSSAEDAPPSSDPTPPPDDGSLDDASSPGDAPSPDDGSTSPASGGIDDGLA